MTAATMRLAGLATVANLRAAGALPWLLLLAWIVVAAGQEPTLLRSFGIYLVQESATVAGAVVLWILLASSPSPRSAAASVLRDLALTLILVTVSSLFTVACALVRGGGGAVGEAGAAAIRNFVILLPAAVYATCWRRERDPGVLLLGLAQTAVALAMAVRLVTAGWSWLLGLATIAGLVTALVFPLIYARQKP